MTTITPTTFGTTAVAEVVGTRRPVWRAGVVSSLVAAGAAMIVVAVARAGDIPVAVDGEEIPILGFAMLVVVGALIGIGLAALLRRYADHPRRTFTVVTVALTALSLVPDVLADASTGSKLVLAMTHVVAAAIIVPSIASRLAD
jgi:peptidoglycan/LPS O-acetylase OafA/YrhL